MSPEEVDALVPIAAELIGSIRDYGPEVTEQILARVPNGRHDALAVVLAAMVDPDARPSQLLAWMDLGPVPARDFTPSVFREESRPVRNNRLAQRVRCECGEWSSVRHLARHRQRHAVAS